MDRETKQMTEDFNKKKYEIRLKFGGITFVWRSYKTEYRAD